MFTCIALSLFRTEESIATRVPCLDLTSTQWDTLTVQNLQPIRRAQATKVILSQTRSRDVGEPGSGQRLRPAAGQLLELFPKVKHIVMHGPASSVTQIIPAIQPRRLEQLDLAVLPRNTQSVPAIQCARFCVEKVSTLITLRLDGFMNVDGLIPSLAKAPFLGSLRELHLGDHGFWGMLGREQLTKTLNAAKELTTLSLDSVNVGDLLSDILRECRKLRSLSLPSPALREKDIAALVEHPSLRSVSLLHEPLCLTDRAIRERLLTRFGPGFRWLN